LQAEGVQPFFIYTTITRCHCDFNRPAETAFEDPAVAPFYNHYHGTIAQYLKEIAPKGSQSCFLLDIHGQSEPGYKDKILRGTQNGKTMPLYV
jgi:hypothetical protein